MRAAAILNLMACSLVLTGAAHAANLTAKVQDSAGNPVPNVTLQLDKSLLIGAQSTPAQRSVATGITDQQGKFTFTSVPAGGFELTARREGFLPYSYASGIAAERPSPLSMNDKDSKEVTLTMTRTGSFSGRVLDEDGKLYPDADGMSVFRMVRSNGQLVPVEVVGISGDRSAAPGEFRFYEIPPGDYYLVIFPGTGAGSRTNPVPRTVISKTISAPDQVSLNYVRTYFPNATDLAAAGVIRVLPGQETKGIDVRLGKARVFRVSGKATESDLQDRQAEGPTVHLTLREFPLRGTSVNLRPDGSFEFANVAPGDYHLSASLFSTVTGTDSKGQPIHGPRAYAAMDIVVSRQDITDLKLPGSNFDLPGIVKLASDTSASDNKPALSIAVGRRMGMNPGASGSFVADIVKPDGSFVLYNLIAENYQAQFPITTDTYLSSVRLGDEEIRSTTFDFRTGPRSGPLVITLNKSPGRIVGAVTSDKPTTATTATVILVPEARNAPEWNFRRITTDAYGQFSFNSVAPGEYRAYAWEELDEKGEFQPALLKPYRERSELVTVTANSATTVPLTLITK
ncbi:MAG: carboxypeptidase regulatory-like domain-containing protein [Acidobacteriota bacterium]